MQKHVSSWLYVVNIKNYKVKVVTPKRVRQSVLQKLVLCTLRIEQSVHSTTLAEDLL